MFITFGELNNHPIERTSLLHKARQNAGVNSNIVPNIEIALWQKLTIIVSTSGIGAITRVPCGYGGSSLKCAECTVMWHAKRIKWHGRPALRYRIST